METFDCTGVQAAKTQAMEMKQQLQAAKTQINEMQSKMKEMQQREKKLAEKQAAVKKLIEEAERKGADTSALQEEKEELEAVKAELRKEYEEYEEKMGLLSRRDALLDKIETAVAIVALVPLPGIDAVCAVCRGIVDTLRALTEVAEDIISISMLVSDVMDYMQRLRGLLPDLEADQRDKIGRKLDVLKRHLDAVIAAIADFQKKGWLGRCAKAKKARKELTNLDKQIRQVLVLIDQTLNLEMLKLNLRPQSYPMETAMEAHAPHLLTESAHVDALIAVAKAGGVSEEAFAVEVDEMRAELQSMGTDVTDLTKRYGEALLESFEQLRFEQRAMEAKLLASSEMLKEEINKRADTQDKENTKMVGMLQQLLDRPGAGASVEGGSASAGATAVDRMAAMEARQQLLEGATLVVQGREQEGMQKFAEVSSRSNDEATSAMSEMSSMAAVARGAVEAKNGQSQKAQEEYHKAVEMNPGLLEELGVMGDGEVGRLLEVARRVRDEEEQAKQTEEERAKNKEREEKARKEHQEKEKARKETEERARKEQEENAKKEHEEKARKEQAEKARKAEPEPDKKDAKKGKKKGKKKGGWFGRKKGKKNDSVEEPQEVEEEEEEAEESKDDADDAQEEKARKEQVRVLRIATLPCPLIYPLPGCTL
jgi:hypothetical protein